MRAEAAVEDLTVALAAICATIVGLESKLTAQPAKLDGRVNDMRAKAQAN